MSKVYLKDEATGAVVSQDGSLITIEVPDSTECVCSAAEFRAVLEGGLRWMLETGTPTEVEAEWNGWAMRWLKEKMRETEKGR